MVYATRDFIKKNKVNGYGKLLFLLFLLFMVVAFGCGYLYYQYTQYKAQLDLKFNDINSQIVTQINADRSLIQSLEQNVLELKEKVIKLSALTDINRPKLLVYQIRELVNMANQTLLVYNDIKGSIQFLTYAQNILNDNANINEVKYTELRVAIAKNIEQLNTVVSVDNVSLSGKLDAIMWNVQKLPFYKHSDDIMNKKNQMVDNDLNMPRTLSAVWQNFWDNIKKDLALLIKVTANSSSKTSNVTKLNSQVEVSKSDEAIVQQRIKLYLIGARIALLQRDQVMWNSNLLSAARCFGDYYLVTPSLTQTINSLHEMADINIGHVDINLEDTISVLNKVINTL